MLMISAVIVEIGVTGAFLAFVFVRSGASARANIEAATVARAGIQDALLRLTRDKNLSTSYALTVGSYSTTVTVTKDNNCTGASTGRTCITSLGTVLLRQKKFQAITAVDSTTGEVRTISLFEVPI